jgi:hypothetical protein
MVHCPVFDNRSVEKARQLLVELSRRVALGRSRSLSGSGHVEMRRELHTARGWEMAGRRPPPAVGGWPPRQRSADTGGGLDLRDVSQDPQHVGSFIRRSWSIAEPAMEPALLLQE